MLFTSAIFLFLFLPTVLGIYYLAPNRLKNVVLLIASLLFYSWGETILVSVMIATIVIDFFAARLIEDGRRKLGLWLSLVSNLSMLGFFKYFNFAIDNYNAFLTFLGVGADSMATFPYIILPLGISFYTFQSLSYTIDVYRGEVKANRNLIDFAAFVTVFPQLIAGPIVRYIDVEEQFKSKDLSLENFSEGIRRFAAGLA
jgi:alginate O-acetyltransferase complex protein AlgI